MLRRATALLSPYLINHNFGIRTATALDIIKYLEQADESLKGLADFVERASIAREEKVEDDGSVTLITIRNKNKGERLEAI